MSKPLRVLIVEDSEDDAALLLRALRQGGYTPEGPRVQTEPEYLAQLQANPDVILSDYTLPQFGAPRALRLWQERGLDIPFIVVTGSISEEVAVECMKQGA
ncbi:MAG: response regulator, partial [Anaerolineales bacterium]